jgi:YfiH family protein
MPFTENKGIKYYYFENFGSNVVNAFFTRRGGFSHEPWKSLNMGSTVGDDIELVTQNKHLALLALGIDPLSVFDVWQSHGKEVAIAESPRSPGSPHMHADIIITNKPGVTLMMRFADCVPIMLYDPIRKVVGIAHAGWMGTILKVVMVAVRSMEQVYSSKPTDILAAIGPSIGPDHYEIGPDVSKRVKEAFGTESEGLIILKGGVERLNLWQANRKVLNSAGVSNIAESGICTACNLVDWFSHRAEKGKTGRFGAVITLV